MTASLSVAMISMHPSPHRTPGRGETGGMDVAVLALSEALARSGIAVDVLTRAERRPEVTRLSDGVTLRTLAAGPFDAVAVDDLPGLTDDFGEAVATLVGRGAPRYDLLHAHSWTSGLAVLPVALELGLPFAQSFHSLAAMTNRALTERARAHASTSEGTLPPGALPATDRRLYSEAFLANQADAVFAGSSAEVSSLIDDLRAPADKLWVVPPGVDTELFSPDRRANSSQLRAQLRLDPDRPLLVVAGTIEPIKGHDLAVQALAALLGQGRAHQRTPLLVIAGDTPGDGSYREYLLALARSLGVAEHVHLVGAVDRPVLADLFAAASLTLVPSLSETFGLVALESAASGTPVVGSRTTGLAESIADGVSGVLLDSRDAEVWAHGVRDLLDDTLTLDRLGAAARVHAEGFTWATAAASLTGVYQAMLATR